MKRSTILMLASSLATPAMVGCAGHPQPRARCQRPRRPCRAAPNALAPEIGPAERNRLRALAEDPATDDALAYVIASGPDDVTTVDLGRTARSSAGPKPRLVDQRVAS